MLAGFAALAAIGRSQSAAPGDPGASLPQKSPATAAPVDWSPPTEPQLGPGTDSSEPAMQTDGSAPLPTIEWRPAADSSATDAAAAADIAPRVDLAGPGAPKWKVVTYVSQKTTFDDNIYISHSDTQSDVYFSIAPGIAAGWGDFRSALLAHSSRFADQYGQTREPVNDPLDGNFAYASYTATGTHFLSHDSEDAIDQDGSISAQWDITKVLLDLNARVQTLSGPDIDVGTRTKRTLFTIDATAKYFLSDKTSFEFEAGGIVRDYATQLNSIAWQAQLFADYQLFPKTSVGIGGAAGVRTLQTTPDQDYEQFQIRSTYNPTGKLGLRINSGVEIDEAGGSTRANPVFGLGATYAINDTDSINLDASRSTSSSAVPTGETVDSTGINLGIRHRIYSNFSIAFSVGYQHLDYYDQTLSTLVRTDDYIFLRPSLAYDFAQWSQIEIAYEYHRDISTDQPYDFAENIASLQLNFVF